MLRTKASLTLCSQSQLLCFALKFSQDYHAQHFPQGMNEGYASVTVGVGAVPFFEQVAYIAYYLTTLGLYC